MRYILSILFILLSGISVSANNTDSNTCKEITYYSQLEYMDEYLFIDTSFSESDEVFVNSDNIIANINALGTRSHPKKASSNVIVGNQTKQVIYAEYEKNHFSISFSQPIKISEIELNINAFNNRGESISKSIYSGGYFDLYNNYIKGTLLKSTNDTNNIIINSNDILTSSIYVVFDSYSPNDTYHLNYFQINKYKAYKHFKWTTDYIPNVETYTDTICLNVGDYKPNGNNKYKYEDYTSLKVDSSLISDYKQVLKTTQTYYDYGRGSYHKKYSKPMILKNFDKYSKDIVDFEFKNGYFSALNKDNSKYFRINDRQVVTYTAHPVYWTQNYNSTKVASSNNTGWCNHVTGNPRTPCYKYIGHTDNYRLNVYDVYMRTYDNNVEPENQVLSKGTYYLLNKETNNKEKLFESSDNELHFHLNKTGQYIIIGELEDKVGNKNTVESNIFHIDQVPPSVMFNPNYDKWTNQNINVTLVTADLHSGVKDVNYKLNDDIYKPYNNKILLSEEGIHIISAHVLDHVLNETVKTSKEYKIDKTPPKINFNLDKKLKVNVTDELSKLHYSQYAISTDGGLTYSGYSDKIYENDYEIELMKDAAIRVKVRAYDNANNEFIKESELYETYNSKASLEKLFSYSYDKDKDQELMIQINCDSCKQEEERNIKLYIDNKLYKKDNIKLKPNLNNISLNYNTNKDSIKIKVEIHKEDKLEASSEIVVYTKSYRYIKSYDNVNFDEIVASYIEKNKTQHNYHEYLSINTIPLQDKYFQGQGIEVKANITYLNECHTINNFVCQQTNELISNNIYSIFDNGTTPIKNNYINNNLYYINMLINNNLLMLPEVYVDKHTGEVYKDYKDTLISGYNRWYTDKELELGKYILTIQSKQLLYNNVSFDIILNYNIDALLKDQYNVRFIDPNKPYLDNNSIWNNSDYKEQLNKLVN